MDRDVAAYHQMVQHSRAVVQLDHTFIVPQTVVERGSGRVVGLAVSEPSRTESYSAAPPAPAAPPNTTTPHPLHPPPQPGQHVHVHAVNLACAEGPYLAWLCDCKDMDQATSWFEQADLTVAKCKEARSQPRCVHSLVAEKLLSRRQRRELVEQQGQPVRRLGSHRMATVGNVKLVEEVGGSYVVSVAVAGTGVNARRVYHVRQRDGLVSCPGCRWPYRCPHVQQLRAVQHNLRGTDKKSAAFLANLRFLEKNEEEPEEVTVEEKPADQPKKEEDKGPPNVSWRPRFLHERVPQPKPGDPMPSCYWCRQLAEVRRAAWLAGGGAHTRAQQCEDWL